MRRRVGKEVNVPWDVFYKHCRFCPSRFFTITPRDDWIMGELFPLKNVDLSRLYVTTLFGIVETAVTICVNICNRSFGGRKRQVKSKFKKRFLL